MPFNGMPFEDERVDDVTTEATAPPAAPVGRRTGLTAPLARVGAAHPLEPLAARAAWLLKGCEVTLIPGANGPAMVMVERLRQDGRTASHTWLLTPVSPTTLELETIVGETRLDLVAEGPPDRLLAWLWRLNIRAARAAARNGG
jgi:hypothetical protein